MRIRLYLQWYVQIGLRPQACSRSSSFEAMLQRLCVESGADWIFGHHLLEKECTHPGEEKRQQPQGQKKKGGERLTEDLQYDVQKSLAMRR